MFGRKPKNQRRNVEPNTRGIYSYYSNTRLRSEDQKDKSRSERKSKEKPARKPGRLHHLPSYIALGVMVICLGYVLSINTEPRIIQPKDSSGLFLRDKATYQAAASEIIGSSFFNFNKITINTGEISNKLKQQFPELADVAISVPLINRRPVIHIGASQLALVLVNDQNSMLVDDRGIIILPVNQVRNISKYKLISVKDESGIKAEEGAPALPTTDVKFILDTHKQFSAESIEVDGYILPAKANELDVKLTGQRYYIKMDMQGNSREQVGALKAALKKIKSSNQAVNQYVDVRVSGRVFFR